ncbi:putative aldouronate transport system permease protein [Caldicoprobacter guelmensis]|uniref:carbohydrate ABC transporter permease n=1 Tax=Caldicoprobacter guelmensis TaxID=1170224 RepID=UPI001FAFC375|nr:carbohydrate ABC transporter permease [Caldicoprobacter guelmensis]MBM7583455.1 putative aldouronate transport system permease protein [Caldicoprobacter guelmensis]
MAASKGKGLGKRIETLDVVLLIFLTFWAIVIILPFLNVIGISFASEKEYYNSMLVLIPKEATLENYKALIRDGRIWIGYRTTLLLVLIGVSLNMFLTTSMAYGLSRPNLPFRRFFVYFIVFTMMFNGGIIPLYLLMKQLNLINTLWSVILATGLNSFYLIIMRNYFLSLPQSLVESAKLDGAREWRIMVSVILPISMPIIATLTLFYAVDRWNEWFLAMIFIRKRELLTLQLALRSIVMESQGSEHFSASQTELKKFSQGMKMAAVLMTMVPIMCVFPFLQKYFVKGILIGAIKG